MEMALPSCFLSESQTTLRKYARRFVQGMLETSIIVFIFNSVVNGGLLLVEGKVQGKFKFGNHANRGGGEHMLMPAPLILIIFNMLLLNYVDF